MDKERVKETGEREKVNKREAILSEYAQNTDKKERNAHDNSKPSSATDRKGRDIRYLRNF